MPLSPRQPEDRTRAARGAALLALARARLGAALGARLARFSALGIALLFGAIAVGLRIADGGEVELVGLPPIAAAWATWLVAFPIGISAASTPERTDRADGVSHLAHMAGADTRSQFAARVVASAAHIGLWVGVPVLFVAALSAGMVGDPARAARGALVVLGATGYAIAAGLVVGVIAAFAGRVGGSRGRSVFLGAWFLPWMLAGWAGQPTYSLPGALARVRGVTTGTSVDALASVRELAAWLGWVAG